MTKLTEAQRLACDAYDLIRRNPFSFDQTTWRSLSPATPSSDVGDKQRTRCGTKLCWGGHLVVLAGGKFVTNDVNSEYYQKLLAESGDNERDIERLHVGDFELEVISVPARLSALLGMSEAQLSVITSARNSVSDIRDAIKVRLNVDPDTREVLPKRKPAFSSVNYGSRSGYSEARYGGCGEPDCGICYV